MRERDDIIKSILTKKQLHLMVILNISKLRIILKFMRI